MHARCPKNPDHKKFVTSASEVHDWLVDEHGNFLEDRGCTETLHKPHADNIWECAECGYTAVVTNP